ncbi:hypothetical protein XENOCAPTIV_015624, partial [Xenoophorus captivus]
GQLNQIYGMPKVESSPTSPLRQPLQPGAVDPAFSCLPSRHGSSLSLSVEVCVILPSFNPSPAGVLQQQTLERLCFVLSWTAILAFPSISRSQAPRPLCSMEQRRWGATQAPRYTGWSLPAHAGNIFLQEVKCHVVTLLCLAQQSLLLAASSTGSLPRNLAATLQDIETKRQLALQQKGQQVIEEQRRRLAELKQRAAAEAQCQWEALHGSQPHLMTTSSTSYSSIMAHSPTLSHNSSGHSPMVHHSILHHHPPSAGEQPYDTLSLESSDSMDTSVSTGNNSACSPDNMSGWV